MDDIVKEAANGFKIKLNNYSKSKAAFILNTDTGIFVLKRQVDRQTAENLFAVTESLYNSGFENSERYMISHDKPYVCIRESIYTLSTCGKGLKCNFSDTAGCLAVAAALAKMGALTGVDTKNVHTSKTAMTDYYSRRISEARHIKKWLNNKSHLTDIDVQFIKSYEKYLENAENAAEKICNFLEKTELRLSLYEIKEDNISVDDGGAMLLNFENCVLAAPHTDLCRLLRRFVKRGGNCADLQSIISAYSSISNPSDYDMQFIRAFLLFPHKFFTIVNKYYNSRKAYDNSHTYAKLKIEAAHYDIMQCLLNGKC